MKTGNLIAGNLIAYGRSYPGAMPPKWILIADEFMWWKLAGFR